MINDLVADATDSAAKIRVDAAATKTHAEANLLCGVALLNDIATTPAAVKALALSRTAARFATADRS
ncbi:hypothetical protein GCM10011583_09160 [Streptomyces camponoticapitis]|uniref:Uncharacterized protein n=1 Tax=Streptomyces camponoticapitis TaxID=1616125 RepID=A0ABQ2DZ27_9ACTN|nr:hypothetical protein GCM10011583_09160 [Streptomyces camponoticapitis]